MTENALVISKLFNLEKVARNAREACERENDIATIALIGEALELVNDSLLLIAERVEE